MAEIELKTEHKRARFRFDDGKISVHFDYKNGKYTGIRMWKLWQYIPIKLFWSMPMEETRALQGWFFKEGDLMEILCGQMIKKNNFKELEEYLTELEKIISTISGVVEKTQ